MVYFILVCFILTWLLIEHEGRKTRRTIMEKLDASIKALEQEVVLDIVALGNLPNNDTAAATFAARIDAVTAQLSTARAALPQAPAATV